MVNPTICHKGNGGFQPNKPPKTTKKTFMITKKIGLYKKITEKKKHQQKYSLKNGKPSRCFFPLNSTDTSFPWPLAFDSQPSVFGTDVLPESTDEEATELFARRNVESFGEGLTRMGGHRRRHPLGWSKHLERQTVKKNLSHKKMDFFGVRCPIKTSGGW